MIWFNYLWPLFPFILCLFFYGGYLIVLKIVMITRRFPQRKLVSDSELPTVEIIIPTYNEQDSIGELLDNTLKVDYPYDRIKIVVVDSGSKDRTLEIVERYLKDKRVQLIALTRRGWNFAVKTACEQSESEVIVLAGADVFYHPDALRLLCAPFQDLGVGGVTGRQVLFNANQTVATEMERDYREWQHFMAEAESLIDQPFDLKGEIVAIRTPIILRILDRIGDRASADTCVPMEVRANGLRFVYEPRALYFENTPSNSKDRLRMQIRRGRNLIECTFYYWWMLGRPKYGRFGTIIFPYHFALLTIMPWVFLGGVVGLIISTLWHPLYLVLLAALGLAMINRKVRSLFGGFLMGQVALAIGLCLVVARKQLSITRIDSTRKYAVHITDTNLN